MNITYLFGNGFDLNIGLKTRYSDFYEYYLKIPSNSNHIEKFKKDLETDLANWADLELELGKYAKNITCLENLDIIFDDICENLSMYLSEVESNISVETLDKLIFSEDLTFPEQYLVRADINSLRNYKDQWARNYWNVNIITFNYTTIIEKMMGGDSSIKLRNHHTSIGTSLNKVYHIHGLVNDGMMLGVNDASQIHNDALKTNDDVLTTLIKPKRNEELKELVDKESIDLIRKSQLIVLFGVSLGDTDKFWWELIGNWLVTNNPHARLLLFWRGDNISANQKHKKVRNEKILKNLFLSKTELTPEQKEDVMDRIYIGYNTNIFKIKTKIEEGVVV